MKEFPIFYHDLSDAGQAEFERFMGGEENINFFLPIATVYVDDDAEKEGAEK